jgi:hypothetical protein
MVRKASTYLIVATLLLAIVAIAGAQGPSPHDGLVPNADVGTGFTYQGQLEDAAFSSTARVISSSVCGTRLSMGRK